MKTANEILEEKIWAKWGQTLYTLSDDVSGNTLIQMIRPQILEAMEHYYEQKLNIHSVMQAEGSAVGQRSGGKSVCVDKGRKKDGPCKYPIGTCEWCANIY